jgi:hypothetical protein
MKRLAVVSAWLAVFILFSLVWSPAGAQDDKVPDVKAIMGKLNKGPKAMTAALKKDLGADEPDWVKIQKDAKEFAKLATAMGKNEPPKGSKESWEQLTKQYAEYGKALEEAAQKKDKTAAKLAHGKLSTPMFCKSCHSVHK